MICIFLTVVLCVHHQHIRASKEVAELTVRFPHRSGGGGITSGVIPGAVTVGTGSGTGALLQPAVSLSGLGDLVIQGELTFKADSDYQYKLNTKRGLGDQVMASGITIESGAAFEVRGVGNKKLTAGTIFVVLYNTTSTPTTGNFINLPNHATLIVGKNSFQVNYKGGDGNDLTITVLP